MNYQGIIITGKKGAGKSEISNKLCEMYKVFQQVKAVTTRKYRSGDSTQEYKFISKDAFKKLKEEGKLLLDTEYMGEFYGITTDSYERVIEQKKIPILVITPESVKKFIDKGESSSLFLSVFLNASDDDLDKKLNARKEPISEEIIKQRNKDEEFAQNCLYIVKRANNVSLEYTADLIYHFWNYKNIGGLCPKSLIELMIKGGMLLEDVNLENIQGASYDLRLGDEYFHRGEIKKLSEEKPFIIMKPGDYVLVSSIENCNFPNDIAGRFDLSVGLFFKGIILSNGPQIDPGFQGKLFCLLFNTSNQEIQLKRSMHFATIEFLKLLKPTAPYKGKYQGKASIQDYLPLIVEASAINKLMDDVETLKSEKFLFKITPLVLAGLSIVVTIGIFIFMFLKK
jgi:deoxycytidine triphosphate deaminase